MQTVTEHLTSDFEVHPIGTGAELARLNDQVRMLADALQALANYTGGWDAKPGHPCHTAAVALEKAGRLPE